MTVITTICFVLLASAALLCLVQLLRRPSLADRIVALDTLLILTVMAVAVFSVRRDTGAYVTVALIVALVAFVGTVTVARFIERRGA